MFGQKQRRMQIGQGVFQPRTAQRAQKRHAAKALLQQNAGGVVGVGIVLDMGQHNGPARRLGLGSRVKIPHNQVRHHPQKGGIAVARITGHQIVAGMKIRRHGGGHRHSGKNHSAGKGLRFRRRHGSHSFS